jgi:hypothetical protein
MANEPTRPNLSPTFTQDVDVNESICVFGTIPTDSNGALQTRADYALWDPTSSSYVSIQNSNAGTTGCLKIGQ